MVDGYLVYPLYLFYGMAFFAMGVSITSRDTRASDLNLARGLWLFALFAYTHALLEWYSLYLIIYSVDFLPSQLNLINSIKLFLLTTSFYFLLLFGVFSLGVVSPRHKIAFYLIIPLFTGLCLISTGPGNFNPADFNFGLVDLRIRNWVGFPGGLISGLGLLLYSHSVRHISRRGALSFLGAGISLACYGILAGLIASGAPFPVFGGPIELYRGLSALIILFFVMNALLTFDAERKLQIEERLNRFAQSEKLHSLGKLAFGIAHEINNPLGNVSINTELLRNDLSQKPDFERYEKRLTVIERNIERASKIAKELLFFASNKQTDFQATDINEVIESTLELLGSRRKNYDIETNLDTRTDIQAIPWKLEEVFLNILINAMDCMPDGGRIMIVSKDKTDGIQIIISDSGPGISSDNLPHVLDPFFTTKAVGSGTGLGLSICYGIMEMHGGSIRVTSPNEGGTEVFLDFPSGGRDHV